MKRHECRTFIEWWAINEREYRALIDAEDGNPIPLAKLIKEVGHLATKEAREFLADHLEGKKKKRGVKRTAAQQAKELGILGMVREIQDELGCGEHKAMSIFMDRHPDICENADTLKTYLSRAKSTLKEIFGRKPSPVVRKRPNSEPEQMI